MSVALRYYLRRQCTDQFCRYCENTFKQSICFPRCEGGPTVVCLKAKIPRYAPGTGSSFCCFRPPEEEGIPYAYTLTNGRINRQFPDPISECLTAQYGPNVTQVIITPEMLDRPFVLYYRGLSEGSPIWVTDLIPYDRYTCAWDPYSINPVHRIEATYEHIWALDFRSEVEGPYCALFLTIGTRLIDVDQPPGFVSCPPISCLYYLGRVVLETTDSCANETRTIKLDGSGLDGSTIQLVPLTND